MKQRTLHFVLKILFIVISIPACDIHVASGQSRTDKLEGLMKLYNEYGQFNGTVLVAEHGKVIYQKGFGYANMEWDISNQPDTKFRIGSITKQFTSMLIMQLIQEGKLKSDGKITEYLPDYPGKTGDKITIHQLMTHTSGIPGYTEFPNFFRDISRDPYLPEAFIRLFADSSLLFEPGTKFSYSNSGYFLLGVIIEKVTGKPYELVLQERIFGPAGMKNTGYDHQRTILKKRASGYEKDGDNYTNAEYLDMSLPYSAGSLYSTAEDLYIWDQALYTDKLLSERMRDLMFTPFTPYIPAFGGGYGYGWVIGKLPIGKTSDSVMVIEHSGGNPGFNTLISRIPSDKNLVVLLNNTGVAPLGAISLAIRGILYDKSYDLPKKSIAYAVLHTMLEDGIANAIKQYNDLKDNHPDTYALDEGEMNNVGYRLLQANKVKEAIEIFKLNVDAFPKSSNVYDSLGEAYMVNGDKELAIRNYQKSVELDPRNDNGTRALKKLQAK